MGGGNVEDLFLCLLITFFLKIYKGLLWFPIPSLTEVNIIRNSAWRRVYVKDLLCQKEQREGKSDFGTIESQTFDEMDKLTKGLRKIHWKCFHCYFSYIFIAVPYLLNVSFSEGSSPEIWLSSSYTCLGPKVQLIHHMYLNREEISIWDSLNNEASI